MAVAGLCFSSSGPHLLHGGIPTGNYCGSLVGMIEVRDGPVAAIPSGRHWPRLDNQEANGVSGKALEDAKKRQEDGTRGRPTKEDAGHLDHGQGKKS
jgi:hypothetical protein